MALSSSSNDVTCPASLSGSGEPTGTFAGSCPGLFLALAFGLGIALAPWLRTPLAGSSLAAAAAALLWARCGRDHRLSRRILWAAVFAGLGGVRGAHEGPPDTLLDDGVRRPGRLRGAIVSVPLAVATPDSASSGESHRLLFHLRSDSPGRLRVIVDGVRFDDQVGRLRCGLLVELSGKLYGARSPRNPGERRRAEPLFVVKNPQAIKVLGKANLGLFEGALLRTREAVHRLASTYYDGESRGLLLALLLGDRRLLSPQLRRSLTATGTVHFLAISGLHVGILMLLVTRVPLPRGTRTCGRLLFLAGFSVLTGGNPPVVRAALMLGLHIVTTRLGRRPQPVNTLGWTALILLAGRPTWLWDLGFQLSFVAVAAIVVWGPLLLPRPVAAELAPYLPYRPHPTGARRFRWALLAWARALLAMSIATSTATAPLVLYYLQRFHPLGPLWTLAVYPLVVVILTAGVVSIVAGLLQPWLGTVLSVPAAMAAEVLSAMLRFSASVPGSCVYLPPPSTWQIVSVYALLASFPWSRPSRALRKPGTSLDRGFPRPSDPTHHKRGTGHGVLRAVRRMVVQRPGAVTVGVGLALVLCGLLVPAHRDKTPLLRVFDVGTASAALLTVPGSGSYLVDACGRSPYPGDHLVRTLLASGHRRLEGVFLTHPHEDHVAGLTSVLDTLQVAQVWISPHFRRFPLGRQVADEVERRGIPLAVLRRGDQLELTNDPPVRLKVLHPTEEESLPLVRRANDTSLCLLLEIGAARLLTLGDLEEQGVVRLLSAEDDLRAGILVLPHHGQWNRRYPELLGRVTPHTVVISGNGFGGAREVANALERQDYKVYATWRRGAVVSLLEGGKWTTRYWVDSDRRCP